MRSAPVAHAIASHAPSSPENGDSQERTRRTRGMKTWLWRCGGLLILFVAVAAIHPLPLTLMAQCLVVDEVVIEADAVVVSGGQACHEVAVEHVLRAKNQQILFTACLPNRLERDGVVPMRSETALEFYRSRGLPDDKLVMVADEMASLRESFAAIGNYLEQHDQAAILVCSEFASRRMRWKINQACSGTQARRFYVNSISDPLVPRDGWWKTRHGLRAFCDQSLSLIMCWLYRSSREEWRLRTNEEFTNAAVVEDGAR